ncbi:MAG: hypothetical protein K6E53_05260 [Lachnospiraceae bacterium]|jgi:flagellar motor switch protein FliM|nr:hypothetical protein [Lachnospiraceae bacterium]
MDKLLSQEEVDSLVDALRAIKGYSDDEVISEDVLNSQVVLSQGEIDKLIESLNNAKGLPAYKPKANVVLSQDEIDSLIDALNTYKEYGQLDELNADLVNNQTIMSQEDIDVLISKLLSM